MKKYKWIVMSLCLGMALTGCQDNKAEKNNESITAEDTKETNAQDNKPIETDGNVSEEANAKDASDNKKEITGSFSIISDSGNSVEVKDNIYTVTEAGTYTLTGLLDEGQIVVDAAEDAEITILLNNASINNSSASPINIICADNVKIKSEENSYNEINDTRAAKETEDTDDNAAVYSKADLSLTGKGSLVINATYNNGIQSTKDLSIKNITLKVKARNHAIKGNDSVTIESGEIIAITTTGNGIKTDNTDVSSKGNQRGNITLESGNIDIYATNDGINAAYDAVIGGDVKLYIEAGDDGIHADNFVTINDGSINVVKSYEGIEGNQIIFNGGSTFVYAKDDGLNAGSGSAEPLVTINGGYLDVTTPSGDTDAIDSNGSYNQTGGTVLVKGGAATGRMAGSLDVNGSITVTGGTIVALGGICETPVNSCNAYVSGGTQFSQGEYKIASSTGTVIMEFTLNENYSSGWICSENLNTGDSYSITKDGSDILNWTQEEGTMGSTGMGGFGGGFGGKTEGGFGGKPEGGNRGERPDGMGGKPMEIPEGV